jgi:hypothetical protein
LAGGNPAARPEEGPVTAIELSYDTELQGYRALYRQMMRLQRSRRTLPALVMVLVLDAALLLAVIALGGGVPGLVIGLAVLTLATFVVLVSTPRWLAARAWKRDGSVRFGVRLDENGVTSSRPGSSLQVSWTEVAEVSVDSGYLFVGTRQLGMVAKLDALPPPWTAQAVLDQCRIWWSGAVPPPAA